MRAFQSIAACLLALLIVNPLCCCAAESVQSDEVKSCCSSKAGDQGNQEKPGPHICACKSKLPQTEAKEVVVPADLGVLAVPLLEHSELPLPMEVAVISCDVSIEPGCDPPRCLLARFSRWLL